jgi:hypothetical protein
VEGKWPGTGNLTAMVLSTVVQPELREVLFPVFVHTFLDLVETARSAGESSTPLNRTGSECYTQSTSPYAAIDFFKKHAEHHAVLHRAELEQLKAVNSPAHVLINPYVKRLRLVHVTLRS